jgi:putative phosphoesterase
MRVLVLSDTHVAAAQVPWVLELLRPHLDGIEHILHAGDAVCEELYDRLSELAEVHAVAGNMDPEEVRDRWPEQVVLELGGRRVGLVHGWGRPQDLAQRVLERFQEPGGRIPLDVLIFGHSHQPLVEKREGLLLLNPGSPVDQRWAPYRSVAELDLERLTARIIRLD